MKRRVWLLSAALLGLLAVNLHVSCAVGFGGEPPGGRYSPAAVRRGMEAAGAAAEEILPGEGAPAAPQLRLSLSLAPPEGGSAAVADASLRATPGVTVLDGVFLDRQQLGAVSSGARFAGRVQAWLYDSMPRTAREAGFVEILTLRPLYAREGAERDPGELLRELTATAQVWYTDAEGNFLPG